MRKCPSCGAEMTEGLSLICEDSRWPVVVAEPRKLIPREVGKLSCAMCPECGHVELYVEVKK